MGKNPNVGTIPSPPPSKEQTRFRKCSRPRRPQLCKAITSNRVSFLPLQQQWMQTALVLFFLSLGKKDDASERINNVNQSFVWVVYRFHNSKLCFMFFGYSRCHLFILHMLRFNRSLKKGLFCRIVFLKQGWASWVQAPPSIAILVPVPWHWSWAMQRGTSVEWGSHTGWLGSIGVEMLPSCIGIIISQYKDPH